MHATIRSTSPEALRRARAIARARVIRESQAKTERLRLARIRDKHGVIGCHVPACKACGY